MKPLLSFNLAFTEREGTVFAEMLKDVAIIH